MTTQLTESRRAFHGGRFFEAIGIDFQDLTRAKNIISADVLDAWFDPSPRVTEKLREYLPFFIRTSPPTYGEGLIRTISETRSVPRTNLCLGGGSSQLIFTCLQQFTTKTGRALILDPTYGEYAHVLEKVLQREVHRHHLPQDDNFRIDSGLLLRHARQLQPELLVLVNPNSPTGQHWSRDELREFVLQLPNTLVLLDETYIDYVSSTESLESRIAEFSNLVIIKSMSKVYALSGLRVAYLAARKSIVSQIACHIPPWAVSLPAQVAAVEALRDPEYYQARYRETHKLRAEACDFLNGISELQLFDSCANFYMVKIEQSASLVQSQLEEHGVFVRHCDSMGIRFRDDFLRIAVKTREQNLRIATAFRSALAGAFSNQVVFPKSRAPGEAVG
jgi:histidinol-phosphate/aromatic aminotransferase/cobyric acid decarboxylase-like protein